MRVLHGLAAAAILCAPYTLPAQVSRSADLSGKWTLAIATDEGEQSRTLDLKVAASGAVSGTVGSPYGDIAITTGRLKGDSLSFEFSMAGGQIRVAYSGVVRNDSLRGFWSQDKAEHPMLGVRGNGPVSLPRDAKPQRRGT